MDTRVEIFRQKLKGAKYIDYNISLTIVTTEENGVIQNANLTVDGRVDLVNEKALLIQEVKQNGVVTKISRIFENKTAKVCADTSGWVLDNANNLDVFIPFKFPDTADLSSNLSTGNLSITRVNSNLYIIDYLGGMKSDTYFSANVVKAVVSFPEKLNVPV